MNIYSRTFARSLAIYPEAPALWVDNRSYSYRALEYWVNGCRVAFQALGLRAGSSVALLASRTPIAYATILACAAEGITWVPLNPNFPDARNRAMLALTRTRVLVVDSESDIAQRVIVDTDVQHVLAPSAGVVNAGVIQPVVGALPLHDINPEIPAYILFTPGSTGEPKGIPVSQGNLDAYLRNFNTLYKLPVRLRYSQMFDFTVDLSMHDLFVCWGRAGCLVAPSTQDVLVPLQYVRRHQIQVWFSAPSIANIAKQNGLLLPNTLPLLQYAFFCGEALPSGSADAWLQAAPDARLVNLYGSTEATIAITAFELARDGEDWRQLSIVPIGYPFPDQHARVIKEDGREAAVGEIGELWLAGSQVARGYLADLTKTFAAFVAHQLANCEETRWHRTGDCARLHPAFGLQYLGRMDQQVKINGHRVELQEVEHALRVAAGTQLAAVVSRCNDGVRTVLVGFVVQPEHSSQLILLALKALLPVYMQPWQIRSIAQLPVNISGKVDYNALHALLEAGTGTGTDTERDSA